MNSINFKIQNLIKQKIEIEKFEFIDESYKHLHHKKDTKGAHIKLFIVSDDFQNLNLIKRHQLIYDILGEMIKTEIHAISMKLLTITEYNSSL